MMRTWSKKYLATFGLTSGLFTLWINLNPDLGVRLGLYIVLGFCLFGASWARTGIRDALFGAAIGAYIGVMNGLVVFVLGNQLLNISDVFIGLRPTMILAMWAIPILLNMMAGLPWYERLR